ncbi:FMN-binding negative transcriptional regulator [Streptomyces sporangiiformans]|uniref:FMN-binding negative transcriptional regulator n=1 Tax=Streptomyces sporangiiformans TaxID=2315329 RepID=A0A505DLE0_9ACTN|nr:FMN-binding negative transcriptional regulator [Streptomyces sporangiiformans]TPQ19321.1 FMN-binding negative transcriptional regulator [Streptomyces sporangiiformans]
MFVPPPYREPDGSWMADVIRNNPLALLVSNGGWAESPFATHLPVIPDPEATGEWSGDLSGAVLLGHMNRANPHWDALKPGDVALLTFTGPHAYVSPTVYQLTPAAPTWNFTSVHARGTIEKIESPEETLDAVTSTVRAFEASFGTGWDMTESLSYFRRLLPGVGGFRFTVSSADGMFKLSQEQAPEIRDRVRQSFSERPCGRHRATASLMSRLS